MGVFIRMQPDKARGCEAQGVGSVPGDILTAALEEQVLANMQRFQISHDPFHCSLGLGVDFCTFSGSTDNGEGCVVGGVGYPDDHTEDGNGNKQFEKGETMCMWGSLHASESRDGKEKRTRKK